jgi:putative hemolysin
MGYQYETVGDGGQQGVCNLPDGSACDAWAFLQGTCGQGFSYCAQQGYETRTVSDGGGAFSPVYAVCVTGDGTVVGSVSGLSNLGEKVIGCQGQDGAEDLPFTFAEGEAYRPAADGDAPAAFDWRSYQGYDWLSPIKDQGGCGSCWAFSAVGTAEAAHNIASGDPGLDKDLSEQYLVSDCYDYRGQSCCGGWKSSALAYIRDSGIPDEGCMPYVDGGGSGCSCYGSTCDANCTYNNWYSCSDRTCSDRCADWSSRLEYIASTGPVSSNPQTIKQALLDKGPLAVSMGVGDDFCGGWDGDIYRCGCGSGTNHAVVIVGYDDAGGYWWVRNSWGTGFQDDGYFKVGYGECSIEQSVYYADASSSDVGPLEYHDHIIDDDTEGGSDGDGDGVVDCGETIELPVVLYNQGSDTAAAVTAVLSTSDAYVSISDSQEDYFDVAGGATATCQYDFDFAVDPSTPHGHVIHFDLDIAASNAGPWSDSFTVPVTCGEGGISVDVVNQSGQPAADAYVQIYSDTGQWPDVTGSTDDTGHVGFADVPPGTYTVVVTSSDDHFLLMEESVTAPTSLSLNAGASAQVDVYTYGLDGATPVSAGILFAPFFTARPDVGYTDANGHLQVSVTPHTYDVIAASFGEPYFLVKPEQMVGDGRPIDFDPPGMAKGRVSFDLLDFASVRIGSWGSHSAWSWTFELDGGQTMTFSPDTYSLGPDLIKSGTQATWYYALDGSYTSYDVVAGASETVQAGGDFAPCIMPDKSFYGVGERVTVEGCFTDAFGNQITRIETYTPDVARMRGTGSETALLPDDGPAFDRPATADGIQAVSGWTAVCPTIVVGHAGGQTIVDQNTCDIWAQDYGFDLSPSAATGLYTVDLSVDTGPHRGLLQGTGHFAADWIFGDFDGDFAVGLTDVQTVANRWRSCCTSPGSGLSSFDAFYDVDQDGLVTVTDILTVVAHYGESHP